MNAQNKKFSKSDFEQVKRQREIKSKGMEIVQAWREPPFGKTPEALLRDPHISDSAVRLFGVLHTYCPDKKSGGRPATFVSQMMLGKIMGKSRSSISKYLHEAHDAGWISIHRRGYNQTNIVFLHAKKQKR